MIAEFLLACIDEDENAARIEVGRRDVILVGVFAPARVLAECEAKRRIVELYQREADVTARTPASGPKTPQEARSGALGEACLLLALPYADHPDYRQEWRFGLRSMAQCGATNPETDRACVLPGRHDGMHQTEVGTWFGESS